MLAPQATDTADLHLFAVHARVAEMEAEEAVICVSVFAVLPTATRPTPACVSLSSPTITRSGPALR